MSPNSPNVSPVIFRWTCLTFAAVVVVGLGWMVNDIRIAIKANIRKLDENLPEILANTKKSTTTLAVLADDIKQLRNLAGVSSGSRDRSLVVYADRLLDLIESSGGQVGLQKKIFGSGLKDLLPANEWVVAARKEALWLSFRAKSKREILERLTKNKFGSAWHIQFENGKPKPLLDWLAEQDPETAEFQEKTAVKEDS